MQITYDASLCAWEVLSTRFPNCKLFYSESEDHPDSEQAHFIVTSSFACYRIIREEVEYTAPDESGGCYMACVTMRLQVDYLPEDAYLV